MYLRLLKRMFLETDKRLLFKLAWNMGLKGALSVEKHKRRLKRGVFRSVADLQATINRFLDNHTAHSKPFEWVADPDKIIAAVKRGHQVLDSIH